MLTHAIVGLYFLPFYLSCGYSTSKPELAVTPDKPAYNSWVADDTADVKAQPLGGVLLAGGSTDVDKAMR